jgi:hypothetical protein
MRLSKITELKNGNRLFAFWANNRGRGDNNCTLQVVEPGTNRPVLSRLTTNVISETRTSSWRGDVNLSRNIQRKLGIINQI